MRFKFATLVVILTLAAATRGQTLEHHSFTAANRGSLATPVVDGQYASFYSYQIKTFDEAPLPCINAVVASAFVICGAYGEIEHLGQATFDFTFPSLSLSCTVTSLVATPISYAQTTTTGFSCQDSAGRAFLIQTLKTVHYHRSTQRFRTSWVPTDFPDVTGTVDEVIAGVA